jgi:hypothetical protein
LNEEISEFFILRSALCIQGFELMNDTILTQIDSLRERMTLVRSYL